MIYAKSALRGAFCMSWRFGMFCSGGPPERRHNRTYRPRGFRRLRRPGSSIHRAAALECSGSAHRAGWSRGSYEVSRRRPLPAEQTSSGVGQPTIGRPFYGQTKGQLRLTWRPSAGSPQKRRISVHGVSDSWGSKYQSAGRHQTYSIPESKRGQAPSAPGFYRSCAAH